ncbi:MAG: type II toxin-antitoxin system Phd/YefM family antitoxin [Chloroflexota bacterium]
MMEFRHQLGSFVTKVDLTQQRYVIQRRGKPKALLVPVNDQEAIQSSENTEKDELDRMYTALQVLEGMIDEPDAMDASETIDAWVYGQAYDEAQQEAHDQL